jgi:hypothetical protein
MRLDDPHPASFAHFACRLREDQQQCESDPDWLIRQGDFTARGAEVARTLFRKALADRERLHHATHRREAYDRGLDLSQPGVRWLIERCASLSAAIDLQAAPTNSRSERRGIGNGWRPLRRTGTFIALGAWLAGGATSYATAADLMNTHRPRLEKMGGAVDRNIIQRAVESEIDRLARPHGAFHGRELLLCRATAWTSVHFTRTAIAVWETLHRRKGCNSIDQYVQAVRRDGRLFELAAKQANLVSKIPSLDVEIDNLAWTLHGRVIAHLTRRLDQCRVLEKRRELAGATNTLPA